ncbi:hypothetical protein HMPREF1601_02943 [Escherichia coli 907779]|nr:hypothetical protein HMPREF1601_02943 [Escherichia coli 907779]
MFLWESAHLPMGFPPPSYGNPPTFLWELAHLVMGIRPPLDGNVKNIFTCWNFVVMWRIIFSPQRQGEWISC